MRCLPFICLNHSSGLPALIGKLVSANPDKGEITEERPIAATPPAIFPRNCRRSLFSTLLLFIISFLIVNGFVFHLLGMIEYPKDYYLMTENSLWKKENKR